MSKDPAHHYVALVSFEGLIDQMDRPPRVWIIPFAEVEQFMRRYSTRVVVSRKDVTTDGQECENAWFLLAAPTDQEGAQV